MQRVSELERIVGQKQLEIDSEQIAGDWEQGIGV
jgi:hypothetical protein